MTLSAVFALYQQYFVEFSLYKLPALLALGVLGILVLCFTTQGREAIVFIKEAQAEIAKVVWPKRQDVIVTTFAVGVAVAIISTLIMLLDSMLVKLLAYITG